VGTVIVKKQVKVAIANNVKDGGKIFLVEGG